jgi:HK97 family phage portal protein
MAESYLMKAFSAVRRALERSSGSRGALTYYSPGQPREIGQPNSRATDGELMLPLSRKRELSVKSPTLGACLNATIDYVSPVKLSLKNVQPKTLVDPAVSKYVLDFLERPNRNDTQKHILEKIYRDLFILNFAAIEIERDSRNRVANLHVLDAARLHIDYDASGDILGYNMRNEYGEPIIKDGGHTWRPEDIILFRRDAESSSVYPASRLDQLFALGVIENLMIAFIGGKFTEGNIPYGVLSLGDISSNELDLAIKEWNKQAKSNHKILLTGSRGTMDWVEFGYALKDLDASALLNEVRRRIMALVGVTDNELGEAGDVNKANGFNLSYTFKRRSIDPLLREACETLTRRLLWDEFKFRDLEFTADEIDSRDELLQRQIDDVDFKNGFRSINEIRNSRGDTSIEGGDEHVIVVGQMLIPVSMITKYAEAQLEIMKAPPASGGAVRSSSPKGDRKPPGDSPQQARGPVQANRNQGVRKE